MKLLVDVNLSPRVVAALCAAGHDAVRASDVLVVTAPDDAILAEAARIGAVIVTRDQDFSALLVISGATAPSLINLRVVAADAPTLADLIDAVVRDAAADLAAGAIVTVNDTRVRIRRLPIG